MVSSAQHVLKLGLGFIVSQALRIVADLEIADRLNNGPKSVADLAAETGANADALYRIMRLLASEGIFCETSARTFELTDTGATLRADAPFSARDMIRMMNRQAYIAFSEIGHSVTTGLPAFDLLYGKGRFDWLAEHPEDAALFQRAMIFPIVRATTKLSPRLLTSAPTPELSMWAADTGSLSLILDQRPQLSGVLFDRPSGADAARERAGPSLGRTDFVSGDFFEAVPTGADVYILKRVIHDWNNVLAVKILRNCCDAMLPGGRVLIVESLIPDGDAPDPQKFVDAAMLVVTGGTERTQAEYSSLLAEAGLKLERVHRTSRPICILEASKIGG